MAIEAGIEQGWRRYIGDDGLFVGMSSFGASGKAEDLYRHFNITADFVVDKVAKELKSRRRTAIAKYKDKDDVLDELDKFKEQILKEVENDDE